MRLCYRPVLALLALLVAGSPATADLVVTSEGGVLKVVAWEIEDGWARLHLEGLGVLTMPMSRIERIVDDELAPPEELAATPEEGTIEMGFMADDAVPEAPYGDLIFETSRRFEINPAVVTAVIRAESAFDPRAVSPKGAKGLMQLMPATAERFGVQESELFEPASNVEAGVRYLSWLVERFDSELPRVLAAYNAGEANVDRYGGVPPFRETQSYVKKVMEDLSAR